MFHVVDGRGRARSKNLFQVLPLRNARSVVPDRPSRFSNHSPFDIYTISIFAESTGLLLPVVLLADRLDKHDEHCSARAQDRTQMEGFAVTRNSMNALKTLRADGPETDMLARGLDWSHVEDAACCETESRRFYIAKHLLLSHPVQDLLHAEGSYCIDHQRCWYSTKDIPSVAQQSYGAEGE